MASSTALRISDDWARHVSYTERQTFQMEHPHDYGSQSAWRTTGADAGPSYSHFANYSHLTAAYRPPSQTSPNDYRTPEPAYSQHEQMYPSQPSYAPDPRYIPVAPSTPQTSSHMQQAHDLRQAPVTPLYPSSPYSHSSAPGYATGISPSSSILPPSAASYHNVPHTAVQDHNTDTVTYSPVDPVPLSAPIAQAGPTVDYEQMLRSYERLLVDLPSADEWSNENARQAMSSASLGGLVSAAVTGLQTLDPNARFESVSPPPENSSELHSVSPSLSSAYQMPIIRTKRRRVIQKCLSCDSTSTPEWRKGPMGPRTLCNACGLVWAKVLRKRAVEEKARSGVPPVPSRSKSSRNPQDGSFHPRTITF